MTLTPKASIHVTSNDKSYIVNDEATNSDENKIYEYSTGERSDNKQKSTTIKWKRKFKPNPSEDCTLKGEVCHEFSENVWAIEVYKSFLKIDLFTDFIAFQTNLYFQQNIRNYVTTNEKMRSILGSKMMDIKPNLWLISWMRHFVKLISIS